MIENYQNATIWIIGASSGIGLALAKELHGRGATLVLSARRAEELEDLNKELGSRHHVFPMDAGNDDSVFKTAEKIDSEIAKLDSMVYLAGTYTPDAFYDLDIARIRNSIDINLTGAMAATLAVHRIFKKQGRGQIALCASVAGYCGLPNAQPYSATKAALINFCETLRLDSAAGNIDVKVISPGFVRTPMTDKNSFNMPMMIEPQQAAKAIADGLQSGRFEIHFPKKFTYLVKLLSMLPYGLYFRLAKKMIPQ